MYFGYMDYFLQFFRSSNSILWSVTFSGQRGRIWNAVLFCGMSPKLLKTWGAGFSIKAVRGSGFSIGSTGISKFSTSFDDIL